MKFYSQLGQDKKYINYINCRTNGFFIEVGASDGTTLSNTKALEDELNWDGLLIEANPMPFIKCKESRKAKTLNLAVYDKKGSMTFSTPDDTLIGGLKDCLVETQVYAYQKQGQKYKDFLVQCDTLYSILVDNHAPLEIDYLSLDTEGSEPQILECFFLENDKYKINYIDVEHNHNAENQERIKKVLNDNGFILHSTNDFDYTFIRVVN